MLMTELLKLQGEEEKEKWQASSQKKKEDRNYSLFLSAEQPFCSVVHVYVGIYGSPSRELGITTRKLTKYTHMIQPLKEYLTDHKNKVQ
jgi:hypothetical protein